MTDENSGQRYTLLNIIGRGGMGVVFRARHRDLDREVAVKFLPEDVLNANPAALSRFWREAQACTTLVHPNIVKVFDVGESNGQPFLVMELLDGEDLSAKIKRDGPIAWPEVVRILDQVLDALDHCHSLGFVHRDIKPSNVFLESSGRAVLMDFGLVRSLDRTALTKAGVLLGTPRFVAPEVLRGVEASATADLWSLGVTTWEVLTGQDLFRGESIREIFESVESSPILAPRAKLPVPSTLARWLLTLLDRDPATRPASAAVAKESLREAAGPRSRVLALDARTQGREQSVDGAPRRSGGVRNAHVPARQAPAAPAASVRSPVRSRVRRMHGRKAAIAVIGLLLSVAAIVARVVIRPAGTLSHRFPRVHPSSPMPPMPPGSRETPPTVEPTGPSAPSDGPSRGSPLASVAQASAGRASRADVLRLVEAVKRAKVGDAATDRAFQPFDRDLRRNGIRDGVVGVAALVARKPSIAAPIHAYTQSILGTPGLASAYAVVRPVAGRLLASGELSREERWALVDALARLSGVDVVESLVGGPVPFGALAAMEPAVEVRWSTDGSPMQIRDPAVAFRAGGDRFFLYSALDSPPAMLGQYRQVLGSMLEDGHVVVMGNYGTAINLPEPRPAGPGGRQVLILVTRLHPEMVLGLWPPGAPLAIPVRQAASTYSGLQTLNLVCVTLRGAMGDRPGTWRLTLSHTFHASPLPSVRVDWVTMGLASP